MFGDDAIARVLVVAAPRTSGRSVVAENAELSCGSCSVPAQQLEDRRSCVTVVGEVANVA